MAKPVPPSNPDDSSFGFGFPLPRDAGPDGQETARAPRKRRKPAGRGPARTRSRRNLAASLVIAVGIVAVTVAAVASNGNSEPAGPTSSSTSTSSTSRSATPASSPTTPPSSPTPDAASTDQSTADSSALDLLATLPVKGRAPSTGYDRVGDFGTAWLDVDRNGCDTRNDILIRDLTGTTTSGPCKVMSGTLVSPYTGQTISFVRGRYTSTRVEIDHVVALQNAWVTGAQQIDQSQREALANDPQNLLAVDGESNQQKSAADAATWLPSNKAFRCTYVDHQITVKAKYGLWVTPAERDAMERVLANCSDADPTISERTPVSTSPPTPRVVPAAPTAPAPASVSYANCSAVRAAHAAPLTRDEPGYSRRLDRDGDGIACE